jgi:hypothetical protein
VQATAAVVALPAKNVPPLPVPQTASVALGARRPVTCVFGDGAACTRGGLIAIVVAALLLFRATFALSRSLSPLIAPRAYRALSLQPGQQGYWDSCVTSSLHAVLITALAVRATSIATAARRSLHAALLRPAPTLPRSRQVAAVVDEPAFFSSDDLYLTTPMSCRVLAVFFAWVLFDLSCELAYWGDWPQDGCAFLVHHASAVLCWGLFLQGGCARREPNLRLRLPRALLCCCGATPRDQETDPSRLAAAPCRTHANGVAGTRSVRDHLPTMHGVAGTATRWRSSARRASSPTR